MKLFEATNRTTLTKAYIVEDDDGSLYPFGSESTARTGIDLLRAGFTEFNKVGSNKNYSITKEIKL